LERQSRVADLDQRPRADVDVTHPQRADVGAVGRAEVAQRVAALAERELEAQPRHLWVAQHQVDFSARAHADERLLELTRAPCSGPATMSNRQRRTRSVAGRPAAKVIQVPGDTSAIADTISRVAVSSGKAALRPRRSGVPLAAPHTGDDTEKRETKSLQ
jgi:hypothetical protein